MTNIVLDPVLIVLDGKMHRELLAFSDVLEFVAPAGGEPLAGIGKTVIKAETSEQQAAAVNAFQEWAAKAGLLVGTRER